MCGFRRSPFFLLLSVRTALFFACFVRTALVSDAHPYDLFHEKKVFLQPRTDDVKDDIIVHYRGPRRASDPFDSGLVAGAGASHELSPPPYDSGKDFHNTNSVSRQYLPQSVRKEKRKRERAALKDGSESDHLSSSISSSTSTRKNPGGEDGIGIGFNSVSSPPYDSGKDFHNNTDNSNSNRNNNNNNNNTDNSNSNSNSNSNKNPGGEDGIGIGVGFNSVPSPDESHRKNPPENFLSDSFDHESIDGIMMELLITACDMVRKSAGTTTKHRLWEDPIIQHACSNVEAFRDGPTPRSDGNASLVGDEDDPKSLSRRFPEAILTHIMHQEASSHRAHGAMGGGEEITDWNHGSSVDGNNEDSIIGFKNGDKDREGMSSRLSYIRSLSSRESPLPSTVGRSLILRVLEAFDEPCAKGPAPPPLAIWDRVNRFFARFKGHIVFVMLPIGLLGLFWLIAWSPAQDPTASTTPPPTTRDPTSASARLRIKGIKRTDGSRSCVSTLHRHDYGWERLRNNNIFQRTTHGPSDRHMSEGAFPSIDEDGSSSDDAADFDKWKNDVFRYECPPDYVCNPHAFFMGHNLRVMTEEEKTTHDARSYQKEGSCLGEPLIVL